MPGIASSAPPVLSVTSPTRRRSSGSAPAARARFLAGSGALSFLRLPSGHPGPLPSPEEAAAYPYNELERAFVADRQATSILGSPETVNRGVDELLTATAADELMITTMVYDPADRLRSFELVADIARASRPAASIAP
jgi:alkanesulfonate monooxygenase SsuD/methylene tetrahydromethanopterin reductase-like flavin-dependent oxidoreductase (luciferase family)